MSEIARPEFSVILPVWNRESEVSAAVESVLNQTFDRFELIVVDDGSTDRTRRVVESYRDPRVLVMHQEHGGVCRARNLGADSASGRFVTFLDSDDEARPSWLGRLADVLAATSVQVIVCGAIDVDPTRRLWTPRAPTSWGPAFAGLPGPFLAGTFAMDLEVFRTLGGYEPDLAYSENTELALRLATAMGDTTWRAVSLDEPLVIHYQREARPYGDARYRAARFVLDSHRARMALDRRTRGLYHGIVGVGAAALGRRAEARRALWQAVRDDPTRLAHLRRLVAVSIGFERRRPNANPPTDPTAHAIHAHPSRLHAVAVTYRRPEDLQRTLAAVLRPQHGIASIVVVDNDPERSAEGVVAHLAADHEVEYLSTGANTGPAGGLAAGLDHLLESVAPDDWVVLIDDDDPPHAAVALAELHELAGWLLDRQVPVGMVGLAGGRLDRRRGRFTRVPGRELHGPVGVDFVGGNQFPIVSVAAIGIAGTFREELFFGFDDLEFGLRLQRHGFCVFADGEGWAAARERAGRTGDVAPPAPRPTTAWRRYYSVRNLIVVLRDEVGLLPALVATLANVVGRPVADLRMRRPRRWRLAVMGFRAGVDAWTRRLGKRVEPDVG